MSKNTGGGTTTIDAYLAVDLSAGAVIGSGGNFIQGAELYTAKDRYDYNTRGDFLAPGSEGYVGFRFNRSGQTHYGFVYVRVGNDRRVIVDYVGWESEADKAITTALTGPPNVPPLPELQVGTSPDSGEIKISWVEAAGRIYTIQESSNAINWQPAISGVSSLNGTRRTFSAALQPGSARFYRLSVQ